MSRKPVDIHLALGAIGLEEREKFVYALAIVLADGPIEDADVQVRAHLKTAAARYVKRIEDATEGR